MTNNTLFTRDFALEYSRRGWKVFPVHSIQEGRCTCRWVDCESPGKHPCIKDGFKGATANQQAVEQFWNLFPTASIGICTGSVSGFFALDIDTRHGGDQSLRKLEQVHGDLPSTVRSITGGGGQHILFKIPTAFNVSSRVNLRPGIDIRSEAAYIVAPPSLHISGNRYSWDVEAHPNDVVIADAPLWLLNIVNSPRQAQKKTSSEWVSILDAAKQSGTRNDSMTRIIGHLFARGVDVNVIWQLILGFNRTFVCPPQDENALVATLESIGRKHLARFQKAGGSV